MKHVDISFIFWLTFWFLIVHENYMTCFWYDHGGLKFCNANWSLRVSFKILFIYKHKKIFANNKQKNFGYFQFICI